jgi:AraC-like DNA-binding protein
MVLKFNDEGEDGQFQLSDFTCPDQNEKMNREGLYRIVWVTGTTATFIVDTLPVEVKKDELVFFTPHNMVQIQSKDHQLISLSFDREFYCINDHDEEVSCYGYLFYGSSEVPIVRLADNDIKSYQMIFDVLREEFEYRDHIQGEMLRAVLKRLLIKSSRLTTKLLINPEIKSSQMDIVRKYNVLIEMHFKNKHAVKDYADMLFKSPKTLSNLFKQYNNKSPLQMINERIVLEAKRLLYHTDKTIEEISFELGYNEGAHFSKFFKKHTGFSPKIFRSGKIDMT